MTLTERCVYCNRVECVCLPTCFKCGTKFCRGDDFAEATDCDCGANDVG